MRELENVTLEVTNKCNFKCKHCCNDSGVSKNDALTDKQIYDIIDQMYLIGVKRLSITGGEPLCDENIFNYIEYAKSKIPVIVLATNGYLISDEIIDRLSKNGVNKISVSLDGTKEYHDKFRGKNGAYMHAMLAINKLIEANKSIKIKSVLTKDNVEQILDLIEITNNLKVLRHEIFPMCPIGRANSEQILTSLEYKDFLIRAVNKIKSLQNNNTVFQFKPVFGSEALLDGLNEESKKKSLDYRCDALDTSLEISSNGEIYPCSFVRIPIGNIKDDKLLDIWNNKKALELYKKIINQNKVGVCSTCLSNDICNGGCYAHKLNGYEEEQADVYCFVDRRKSHV